ncbi:hypothetical protein METBISCDRAFT_11209 [Metschnikowia bicuspidata]|uniref:Uncharacterized protein n=1 Tax=Metschnikowia bicuspidata TaxID=27322 RepID=A0A4P9ZIZ7_9ASCO|nr:hypothetical protein METBISCDRAFT_11209 [Metschnikowia bicuspidata]
MQYPEPLKIISRKLTETIVVACSGFKRFGKVNIGARMAIFNYYGSIVVWSAIPHNDEVVEALKLANGGSDDYKVSHLIIPDKEHTIAAKSFKEKYPELKIIAVEDVDLGELTPIDYRVTSKYAHRILDAEALQEIGITDPVILSYFEFVYLPKHTNKELVMYEKATKTVFEADLLFNLRDDTPMEQFPDTKYPFSGWSSVAKYLNPDSVIGSAIFRRIADTNASAEGLWAIYSWDFDRLVMCHGNILETGGKSAFHKVFGSVLKEPAKV